MKILKWSSFSAIVVCHPGARPQDPGNTGSHACAWDDGKINSQPHRGMAASQGFSLIELILSLGLSILLLTIAFQVYVTIRHENMLETALAHIQEKGRFIVSTMDTQLRMAGDDSCDHPTNPVNANQAIHGYTAENAPAWLQGQVKSGTDVVIVGSCQQYQGQNQFVKTAYFIAPTNRQTPQGIGIDGFFEKRPGGNREELESGVENLKIQYGLPTPDHQNVASYVNANAVSDWTAIRSVSLSLLLNSENTVLQSATPYWFNGQSFTDNGRWLHQTWNTYVFLRELH